MLGVIFECFFCVILLLRASHILNTATATENTTRMAWCTPPVIVNHVLFSMCWCDPSLPQDDCKFHVSTDENNESNLSLKSLNYSVHVRETGDFNQPNRFLVTDIVNLAPGNYYFQMVGSTPEGNESVVISNTVSINIETGRISPHCPFPEFNGTHVNFLCYTELVWQPLQCQYMIKANGHLVDVSAEVTYDEYQRNFVGNDSYVSECRLTIPARSLGFEQHLMQLVLIYTDGNGMLVHYPSGYHRQPILLPPVVRLDSDCLRDMEGTYARPKDTLKCRCYLKSRGFPHGTFRWIWTTENGSVYGGQLEENLLLVDFNMMATFHTFTCQPLSPIADNLNGVVYRPKFFNTTEEMIFTANNETTTLVVDLNVTVAFACLSIASKNVIYKLGVPNALSYYTYVIQTHCYDSGYYMCRARVNFETFIEKRIEVRVKCIDYERDSGNYSTSKFSKFVNVPMLSVLVPVLLLCTIISFFAYICGKPKREDPPTEVVLQNLDVY